MAATERVRILLVEDEPQVRRLVRRLLEAQGYDVEEAAEGKLALGALASVSFDAVVADADMPDMDGASLYRLALACAPELAGRFVFVGASGVCPSGARRLGKPFAVDDLLAEVQGALGGVGGAEELPR